jgi:hypothetical protein
METPWRSSRLGSASWKLQHTRRFPSPGGGTLGPAVNYARHTIIWILMASLRNQAPVIPPQRFVDFRIGGFCEFESQRDVAQKAPPSLNNHDLPLESWWFPLKSWPFPESWGWKSWCFFLEKLMLFPLKSWPENGNKSWFSYQLFLSAFCWKSGEKEKAASFSQKSISFFGKADVKSWHEKLMVFCFFLSAFSYQLFGKKLIAFW